MQHHPFSVPILRMFLSGRRKLRNIFARENYICTQTSVFYLFTRAASRGIKRTNWFSSSHYLKKCWATRGYRSMQRIVSPIESVSWKHLLSITGYYQQGRLVEQVSINFGCRMVRKSYIFFFCSIVLSVGCNVRLPVVVSRSYFSPPLCLPFPKRNRRV